MGWSLCGMGWLLMVFAWKVGRKNSFKGERGLALVPVGVGGDLAVFSCLRLHPTLDRNLMAI
jgi:hypothetical protein